MSILTPKIGAFQMDAGKQNGDFLKNISSNFGYIFVI
jgi:hypothetical protein